MTELNTHTFCLEALEFVPQGNKRNTFDLWETISPSELIQRNFFVHYIFFLNFIYLFFIFGCIGSLLLRAGFL